MVEKARNVKDNNLQVATKHTCEKVQRLQTGLLLFLLYLFNRFNITFSVERIMAQFIDISAGCSDMEEELLFSPTAESENG